MPGDRKIRDDIDSIDYFVKTCSIVISKANSTHGGVWKVTAYTVPKMNKATTIHDSISNIETPEEFVFILYIKVNHAVVV